MTTSKFKVVSKRPTKRPNPLLPFPHLAERVTSPPSITLFYLTHPRVLLGFFHLEQGPRSSENVDCGNICGKPARSN
jgi:hypothetical protein